MVVLPADANRRLTDLAGEKVRLLDLTAAFVEPDGGISAAVMPDRLHLSAAGSERWAKAMRPTLDGLLK